MHEDKTEESAGETARKKILYIITRGSPFGGAQKYVFDLARKLPKEEFEPVVLCGEGNELQDKLSQENIRVIRLSELGRNIYFLKDLKVLWQLVTILREEKPDVIHLNSSKGGGLGALAGRIARVPNIIFTAHGWAWNERRSKSSLLLIRFFSWLTVILCHTVIVISKNEAVQAKAMPLVRQKITVIYNGIGPVDFKKKTDARAELIAKGVPDKKVIWIGTIAELHRNKNLGQAIQAIRTLGEKIIFIVIGDGEEREELEMHIRESGLQEKVFLLGKMENAATYLKSFDVFVLPSVKEGLPYTLLEAGLAGLPCLSTYVGGIPEIIRNNVSGVLVEPETTKIRSGLEFLLNNPDKAKEFAHNLKEKVKKDFSVERMVEETMEVYRNNN